MSLNVSKAVILPKQKQLYVCNCDDTAVDIPDLKGTEIKIVPPPKDPMAEKKGFKIKLAYDPEFHLHLLHPHQGRNLNANAHAHRTTPTPPIFTGVSVFCVLLIILILFIIYFMVLLLTQGTLTVDQPHPHAIHLDPDQDEDDGNDSLTAPTTLTSKFIPAAFRSLNAGYRLKNCSRAFY